MTADHAFEDKAAHVFFQRVGKPVFLGILLATLLFNPTPSALAGGAPQATNPQQATIHQRLNEDARRALGNNSGRGSLGYEPDRNALYRIFEVALSDMGHVGVSGRTVKYMQDPDYALMKAEALNLCEAAAQGKSKCNNFTVNGCMGIGWNLTDHNLEWQTPTQKDPEIAEKYLIKQCQGKHASCRLETVVCHGPTKDKNPVRISIVVPTESEQHKMLEAAKTRPFYGAFGYNRERNELISSLGFDDESGALDEISEQKGFRLAEMPERIKNNEADPRSKYKSWFYFANTCAALAVPLILPERARGYDKAFTAENANPAGLQQEALKQCEASEGKGQCLSWAPQCSGYAYNQWGRVYRP